jgi:putative ABC transport system substrate-binding protein
MSHHPNGLARRRFLAGMASGLVAAPLAVCAQPAKKKPRVAFILANTPEAEIAGPQPKSRYALAFLEGMRARGWVNGHTATIDVRTVAGQPDRYGPLVQELVALHTDVVVVSGAPGVLKVVEASRTIPVVVAGPNFEFLFDQGLARSLARPGGMVTGLTFSPGPEYTGKRLQLLKDAVPRISRVAHPFTGYLSPTADTAARAMSLTLIPVEVTSPEALPAAFAAMKRARADAMLLGGSPFFWTHRREMIDFAARERLPAMYWDRIFPESGGLISYGADYADLDRRAAIFVDKILRGAKPGDLPIEQPTKFELLINLRTAKALGVVIPGSLLGAADQVIE